MSRKTQIILDTLHIIFAVMIYVLIATNSNINQFPTYTIEKTHE